MNKFPTNLIDYTKRGDNENFWIDNPKIEVVRHKAWSEKHIYDVRMSDVATGVWRYTMYALHNQA